MRRPSVLVVVICLLAVGVLSGARSASTRVAVRFGVTGQTAAGGRFGSSAFPLRPTLDGVDGASLVVARLSGGPSATAILSLPVGGPPVERATAGTVAPGSGVWQDFRTPSGCAPYLTFWARLLSGPTTPPGSNGIFLGGLDGTVLTVALNGSAAPGGGTFAALGTTPQTDSMGDVVFLATWVDADDAGAALYRRLPDGTLVRLLSAGDLAPGGGTVIDMGAPVLDCAGRLAVVASIDELGVLHSVLLVGQPSQLQRALETGSTLPGGGVLTAFAQVPALGPDGDTFAVIDEDLTGGALVRIDSGLQIEVLARLGDASMRGSNVAAMGPPTALSGGRAALRAVLSSTMGFPDEVEPVVILGATPGNGTFDELLAAGDASPFGGTFADLGDPAGDGGGALVLIGRTQGTETVTGLLHWTPILVKSLAVSGGAGANGARLLDGGFRTAVPALLPDGGLSFVATLQGGTASATLFRSESPGNPTALLEAGDIIPGHGALGSLDGPPAGVGVGDVALSVTLGDPAVAAYVVSSTLLGPRVRLSVGDVSPLGGTFRTLGRNLSSGGDGRVAFAATLTGATALSGIFANFGTGVTETVAMSGQSAPGGGTLTHFGFSPAADEAGGTAFLAFTSGARTGSGIYLTSGSASVGNNPPLPVALARSDDPAPGGGFFSRLFDPVAATTGAVAFVADLDDGERGLFRYLGGTLHRLLATGEALAGVGTITRLELPAVDDAGNVAVVAGLTGAPFADAVLQVTTTGVEILVAGGDALPGALVLQAFGPLAAAGNGRVAGTVDLGGWSAGSAVMEFTADADGDGAGDPVDCAPLDSTSFAVPKAIADMTVASVAGSSAVLLAWPSVANTAGSATFHDVLTGSLAGLRTGVPFLDAACAAADVTTTSTTVTAAVDDRWFLVRGGTPCGSGSFGLDGPTAAVSPTRVALDAITCTP